MSWKSVLKDNPVPWLMNSTPWTKYRTLVELLERPSNDRDVAGAKAELLGHPKVQCLLTESMNWFPESITRHNVPVLSHYRLRMLADFGLSVEIPELEQLAETIMKKRENDCFAIRQTLPQSRADMGKHHPEADEWHAMPCDSPLLTYTLYKLGVRDALIQDSVRKIADFWQTPRGWFCHFFFVEGQFKKHQIGCPMAGLQALEVFSLLPELKESEYVRNAFAPLQYHRDSGKSLYFFGRSKKFWTLKYPFVWYNALYLADVLTRFDCLKSSSLVKELIDWILGSQNEAGRFTPTSLFMLYKGWDFADKKTPSPWITFLCCRILKQYYVK